MVMLPPVSQMKMIRNEYTEKFWLWLARRIPKKLRYWATIVSCSEATTGQYSDTVVPDLTAMEMLKRIG